MNLETKEERYRVLVSRILTNKATVARGLYDMGLDLKEVKERELYLLEFRTFDEFLEKKIEIGRSTAYRCISIAKEYSLRDFLKWGIKKLEIIQSKLPEEEDRNKFIKEEVSLGGQSKLPDQINRFKKQIGKPLSSEEEEEYELIRQFSKLEAFLESLKTSLASWLASAEKYARNEEIKALAIKAQELSKRLE